MSEEELTIFDILTRPGPELTTEEREEVKKVARQLLARLHELLVLVGRQKLQARAKVRIEIENVLDEGLPRAYSKETYEEKCGALFEHVFESYQGEGRSAFSGVQRNPHRRRRSWNARFELQFGDGARIRLRRYLNLRCGTLTLGVSLLLWELCRSAPSALPVSFASTSIHAVLALCAYRT